MGTDSLRDDEAHASCTLDNPFGLCGACQALYDAGAEAGRADYASGDVALVDGARRYRAIHPEIPKVAYGAIGGYCHGYTDAMLLEIVGTSGVEYEVLEALR